MFAGETRRGGGASGCGRRASQCCVLTRPPPPHVTATPHLPLGQRLWHLAARERLALLAARRLAARDRLADPLAALAGLADRRARAPALEQLLFVLFWGGEKEGVQRFEFVCALGVGEWRRAHAPPLALALPRRPPFASRGASLSAPYRSSSSCPHIHPPPLMTPPHLLHAELLLLVGVLLVLLPAAAEAEQRRHARAAGAALRGGGRAARGGRRAAVYGWCCDSVRSGGARCVRVLRQVCCAALRNGRSAARAALHRLRCALSH